MDQHRDNNSSSYFNNRGSSHRRSSHRGPPPVPPRPICEEESDESSFDSDSSSVSLSVTQSDDDDYVRTSVVRSASRSGHGVSEDISKSGISKSGSVIPSIRGSSRGNIPESDRRTDRNRGVGVGKDVRSHDFHSVGCGGDDVDLQVGGGVSDEEGEDVIMGEGGDEDGELDVVGESERKRTERTEQNEKNKKQRPRIRGDRKTRENRISIQVLQSGSFISITGVRFEAIREISKKTSGFQKEVWEVAERERENIRDTCTSQLRGGDDLYGSSGDVYDVYASGSTTRYPKTSPRNARASSRASSALQAYIPAQNQHPTSTTSARKVHVHPTNTNSAMSATLPSQSKAHLQPTQSHLQPTISKSNKSSLPSVALRRVFGNSSDDIVPFVEEVALLSSFKGEAHIIQLMGAEVVGDTGMI